MSLWHCKDCTAAYSVGAERCPQCGSTDYQTLPVRRAYVCEGCETPYRLRLSSCPRCRGNSFKETSMAKITKAAGATNADLAEVQLGEPLVETRPVHEPPVQEAQVVETDETADEADGSESQDDAEEDVADEAPDYSTWLVVDLKEELGKRELSVDGLKADLVERLEADDTQKFTEV